MRKRFHGLKRLKLRQSWNKYNLYNLSRAETPSTSSRTYYQQKWTAKAVTRAYHGETVREKKWQRMFRPHINSVVPMDHSYLARTDGSVEAAGRGSGKDVSPRERARRPQRTPYMNMVYAPIERRLDTAVFRALFASSARQARQFCVHGWVKVNGKKMIYPGYQLNPGDMFQVDPDRVLFATGAPKDAAERRIGRKLRQKSSRDEETSEAVAEQPPPPPTKASEIVDSPSPDHGKQTLRDLLDQAKTILSSPSDDLSAKKKQALRAFQSRLKSSMSRSNSLTDSIDAQLLEMAQKLNISLPSSDTVEDEPNSHDLPTPRIDGTALAISHAESKMLKQAIENARDNPVDPSKPYATPWRPREYMSAFAFVPRYLEVHHRVCSAVYLRHPIARPGLGEVPTPYGVETNGLAFNWYLRRR